MFPNESKDVEVGWRVDYKGVHEDRRGWWLTLELQPNIDANLRGLRERARGLHAVLGLLRIRLDDQKKIPAGLDVVGLLATIISKKEADDHKKSMKQEEGIGKMRQGGGNAKRDRKKRVSIFTFCVFVLMLICSGG